MLGAESQGWIRHDTCSQEIYNFDFTFVSFFSLITILENDLITAREVRDGKTWYSSAKFRIRKLEPQFTLSLFFVP